ncbi:MAG: mycofactocin biosynthesis glycosyltransferase MftF [Deltaproteobacteria bacterium]|nr:mycofactocin biosynthesis glycosyltransferase MftF [Deltaproteobacteria bacterium]
MSHAAPIARGANHPAAGQPEGPGLAYCLAKQARYSERHDAVCLTLGYPLKVVLLNPVWKGALQKMAQGNWVTMNEIARLSAPVSHDSAVDFLDGLAAKGYLRTSGMRTIAEYPLVSIIIPVRNRPREVNECLRSLAKLDYPASKTEIIVVDDASSDDTPHVISRYNVKLIRMASQRGASYCRNRGAAAANGEILAFLDSDCLASAGWLSDLVPAFQNQAVAVVGGLVDGYFRNSGLDKYEQVKSSLRVGRRFRRSDTDDKSFYVPSCNMLVRKREFHKAGGFNQELQVGEDVDLCWRMADAGGLLEYRQAGRVLHKHRTKWASFCGRRFDYGTSEPMLQKLHPRRSKRFPILAGALCFWASMAAYFFIQSAALTLLPWAILLTDGLFKFFRVRSQRLPLGVGAIIASTMSSYGAFALHLCKFASRYYLLLIPLLLPLGTWLPLGIIAAHLIAGITEYLGCHPAISLPAFMWWFTLEQISYQAGVWWGCLRQRHFRPLAPRPFLMRGV